MDSEVVGGSFRDPSGFLYTRNGTLYRQVNRVFQDRLAAFVGSGLYDELARDRLLIPHRPVGLELAATAEACAVLQPERVGFISYPYEWPFGWLRDAALLTLELQERALTRDFTLRDASAYNVQLHEGRLIFIDTLSFEPRVEGAPWAAYGQFCEHFLVPLALMSMRDIRCGSLLRSHIDGIPLDLGSRLLPASTWIRPGTALHVHLHAWAQSRYAQGDSRRASRKRAVSRQAALGLVKNLRSIIERLTWTPAGTEWADYTLDNNYSQAASASKREIVTGLLGGAGPQVVWDLGANTG
ncbi:MAG: SAM-dependent methyltransferase, partial [Gemmatimonadota bacterium]|nr:SAM-dependent methyltransferase [Gemmatimonadota bacterium]